MDANTRINHAIIILFFENKMSQHKIRDILHVGAGRVSAVIKYFILNQKVLTPKKLGRPPKCTPEIMSKIEQLTTEDRLMSCQKNVCRSNTSIFKKEILLSHKSLTFSIIFIYINKLFLIIKYYNQLFEAFEKSDQF